MLFMNYISIVGVILVGVNPFEGEKNSSLLLSMTVLAEISLLCVFSVVFLLNLTDRKSTEIVADSIALFTLIVFVGPWMYVLYWTARRKCKCCSSSVQESESEERVRNDHIDEIELVSPENENQHDISAQNNREEGEQHEEIENQKYEFNEHSGAIEASVGIHLTVQFSVHFSCFCISNCCCIVDNTKSLCVVQCCEGTMPCGS